MPNYKLQEKRRESSGIYQTLPPLSQLNLDSPLNLTAAFLRGENLSTLFNAPLAFFSKASMPVFDPSSPGHAAPKQVAGTRKTKTPTSKRQRDHENLCPKPRKHHANSTIARGTCAAADPRQQVQTPSAVACNTASDAGQATTSLVDAATAHDRPRWKQAHSVWASPPLTPTPPSPPHALATSKLPLLAVQVSDAETRHAHAENLLDAFTRAMPLEPSSHLQFLLNWEKEHHFAPQKFALFVHRPALTRFRRNIIFWLYELNRQVDHFQYPHDILFLAVQYFDRFLAQRLHTVVSQGRMYLLGLVCLSLAAKMASEYDDPPTQRLVHHLQPWGYTAHDLLACQIDVLDTLQYDLNGITPVHFLHALLRHPVLQNFIRAAARAPLAAAAAPRPEHGHAHVTRTCVDPILDLAGPRLALSLFAPPGTLPSAIAMACLNTALATRFRQLDAHFRVAVLVHPRFLHCRMVNHHAKWMQEVEREGV